MTKKDYIAFARMFSDAMTYSDDKRKAVAVLLCKQTADIFERDNPHFNRQRFYVACEMPESER